MRARSSARVRLILSLMLILCEVYNVRKDIADRAVRINQLYKRALELLRADMAEHVVWEDLENYARRQWAVSYNTLRDYVAAAMAKAKDQIEDERAESEKAKPQ